MLYDTEMQSESIPMNFRGQGHLVTSVKGHSSVICQYFQRTFFSETNGPVSIKWHEGKTLFTFGPGHMTRMVIMSIYGKTLKSFSPESLGRLP